MRHSAWICIAAVLVLAGCHKKTVEAVDPGPRASNVTLAPGSTGEAMSQIAAKFQVPIYAGAVPDVSHFTSTVANNRYFMAYTTADAPDRVVSFYKGNLGLASTIQGAVTVMTGTTPTGADVTINVGLKMDGTGTSFSITIVPQEPQQVDTTPVANTTVPTQAAPPMSNQTPTPAPTAPADTSQPTSSSTTYYVPTSNSPDDGGADSGDSSGDQQSSDSGSNTGSTDQNGQNSTGDGQAQDNGNPPGGG